MTTLKRRFKADRQIWNDAAEVTRAKLIDQIRAKCVELRLDYEWCAGPLFEYLEKLKYEQ